MHAYCVLRSMPSEIHSSHLQMIVLPAFHPFSTVTCVILVYVPPVLQRQSL